MSKVIKAAILAVMVMGFPQVGMSGENIDTNLGTLSEIRAMTTLTEEKIKLLEKQKILKDLKAGKSSGSNSTFEPMSTPPMNMLPENMMMPSSPLGNEEVLGVMGVEGKYSASIRTGLGVYKVNKGDRIAGGVITAISLDKVTLKKSGKSISLPFAE